jgi:uncharacterized protein YfaS (alpha-2-macroglobulin family)
VNRVEELGSRVQDEQSVQFVERAEQGMRTAAESLQQAVRDGSVQPLSVALQNQQVAYQALLGLRAREFQVSRANQPAASSSSSASQQRRQQQLQQLELKNDENRYETQSKALAEEALQAAGYKTGLYTSPHLEDYPERIRINGESITHEIGRAHV